MSGVLKLYPPLVADEKSLQRIKGIGTFNTPAAALKAEGIDVPDGMAVTVVENTDKQFHLVLPPVPTDELSDEALDPVAGGIWTACGKAMGPMGTPV